MRLPYGQRHQTFQFLGFIMCVAATTARTLETMLQEILLSSERIKCEFQRLGGHSVKSRMEDAADEITERIVEFVNLLPKSIKKVKNEPLPEHTQKLFEEANKEHYHQYDPGHQHHHHGHHHHGHGHRHELAADYMSMYGLGQGWGK